ncbi:unnamed protein product [Clonostachys rosea]|uniref:Zn(2)-C6 fungal-type domain-containing protein n=1 Tax=Bionectria ochroleuca TaxID=29856 RepID=A0ABY6U628_BIOOC|nr:unnamed protein product [Clonostachys rosea]
MPGIPRKPYCQPCKRRRVKCDEKWPTCSACGRAGIVCPGPPGMKFVLNNNHKPEREDGDALVYSSKPRKRANGPPASSGSLVLAERPASAAIRATGNNSEFRSYRLLNAWDYRVPMDSCDHLSARLVALMDASPRLPEFNLATLRELPRRLHVSECLEDSVRYWCSSWIDYHRGLHVPSSMSQIYHGKVIRSLQRAIEGPQALSIETAAAATVLYRTGSVFNPDGSAKQSRLRGQATGIVTLTRLRGLPNLDDPFDFALAHEQRLIIEAVRGFCASAETDFYDTPPWQEVRQKVIEKVCSDEGLQEIDILIEKVSMFYMDSVKDMRLCHEDPIAFYDKGKRIEQGMRDFLFNVEALFSDHWAFAEKTSGSITETQDPEFFLGRKYVLEDQKTFDILSNALQASFAPSLFISRIRQLYNEPPDIDIQKKYRECCERYWMFIPHLRSQDPLALSEDLLMYTFTIEAANEQETQHILEFLKDTDVVNAFPNDYNTMLEDRKALVEFTIGGRSKIGEYSLYTKDS